MPNGGMTMSEIVTQKPVNNDDAAAWSTVALGSVASVFNGKTPAKADKRDQGHPVLKIKDVDERSQFKGLFDSYVDADYVDRFNSKLLRADDTLILNAAHNSEYVGSKQYRAGIEVVDALPTGEWLVARADDKFLDAAYLSHWASSAATRFAIKKEVKGIHLYPKDVARLEIPLPPLPEQKRIAAILDKADSIRRNRQQATALADEFLRSVFLDMFGDPVTNPKGWDVKPLSKGIVNILSGWSARGESYPCSANDLGVLRVSAVTTGQFLPEENKLVHREVVPRNKSLVFPKKGDLLFSRANTRELVAASCIVDKDVGNVFLPDKLWRVDTNEEFLLPEYLNFLLWNQRFKDGLTSMATGTSGSMLNISKAKLLGATAPFPDISAQWKFKSLYWATRGVIEKLSSASGMTDHSFSSLSQRAFSGQL